MYLDHDVGVVDLENCDTDRLKEDDMDRIEEEVEQQHQYVQCDVVEFYFKYLLVLQLLSQCACMILIIMIETAYKDDDMV